MSAAFPSQENSTLSEAEILRFDRQFSEVSANDEDFVLFNFASGKAESENHVNAVYNVINEDFETGITADADTMAENNRKQQQSFSSKLWHCDFALSLICSITIACILALVPFVYYILKWAKKQ
jgi:hypothetical protein